MARIPADEVERIKREVNLADLMRADGVELRAQGADLVGLCPMHDDQSPSLVVSPEKGLWHCLGACQTGGSAIDWLMKRRQASYRHALELLRAMLSGQALPEATRKPKLPCPLTADAADGRPVDDERLMRRVVDFYTRTLKDSPEALKFLESRGLVHPALIDTFKLGFANRTLEYRLPTKNTKEGRELHDRLQRLGIERKTGHHVMNGSLVFPIFDAQGRVAQLYGRKVTPKLRAGTPDHLYLERPRAGVWNGDALLALRGGDLILCEAIIDGLSFWCANFRNVTASFGADGFTLEMLEAIVACGIVRVFIAYDRDEAGDNGAASVAELLTARGVECFRVLFPADMDANEYAREQQRISPAATADAFERLLRLAEPIGRIVVAAPAQRDAPQPGAPQREEKRRTEDNKPPRGDEVDTIEGPEPSPLAAQPSPIDEPAPKRDGQPQVSAAPAAPVPPEQPQNSPSAPAVSLPYEEKAGGLVFTLGDRVYRVRGLEKNHDIGKLMIALRVSRGDSSHSDKLDLVPAKPRELFIKAAAKKLGLEEAILDHDLGRLHNVLEELQERLIEQGSKPKGDLVELTEEERAEAMGLLRDPNLVGRILADLETCGIVGEEINKLAGYLAAVSRKLEKPLSVIVQSLSAAGKSTLLEGISALVPEEEQIKLSAMTGQALYYVGEEDLVNKLIVVSEEEGAERASYPLKLLVSEGELMIATTEKDPITGEHQTKLRKVKGPVAVLLTTTNPDPDPELLNRSLVLTVDEGRAQTRRIQELQRLLETAEGLFIKARRKAIRRRHQNAQRLLKPVNIANPYARDLGFTDEKTRTRRDHAKYLGLIRAIALLHQYQRSEVTKEEEGLQITFIEVVPSDIDLANKIANAVMGRSLLELPEVTRQLLELIDAMVKKICEEQGLKREDLRFMRKEIREYTGWGDTQLKIHLKRLEDLEYLLIHRGGRGLSIVYELLYDGTGRDEKPFVLGLIDPAKLVRNYDEKKSGFSANQSAPSRPQVGAKSGPSRPPQNGNEANEIAGELGNGASERKNEDLGGQKEGGSYGGGGRSAGRAAQ